MSTPGGPVADPPVNDWLARFQAANTASELRAVRDRLQGLAADPANPVPAGGGGTTPADPTV
jgi:hypothetical protein